LALTSPHALQKIVSGGQTGADRAALDAARAANFPFGGWIPQGRWAEDGAVDPAYSGLRETASSEPAERTRLNVIDSDATLIVSHGPLIGGTALSFKIAVELAKPVLHIDLRIVDPARATCDATHWLCDHEVEVLNVAGARASADPEIYAATFSLISAILTC
jgi:hypothetical protein